MRSIALVCLFVCGLTACSSNLKDANAFKAVETLQLQSSQLEFSLTPNLGGRVLAFHLKEQANLLKVGEAVESLPNPNVDAFADNIGYLGHVVWLGPQNAWWQQQNVNPERRAEHAPWPPDPYSIFATNQVLKHTLNEIELLGVESPVWGTQIRKNFRLLDGNANALVHRAEVTNISQHPVSWDVWFNTRVQPTTKVFVPVAGEGAVQLQTFNDALAAPHYQIQQQYLVLDLSADKSAQQGKLLIQPRAGWMAGLQAGQWFIIQFPLHSKAEIHPQQGQVELYAQVDPVRFGEGLIEMEVHAPYKTLASGEAMSSEQVWYLYPDQHQTQSMGEIAYLKSLITHLNLQP